MSAPEPQVRDADLGAAILVGQVAVRNMAFDWYCPRDRERPRFECRECVAEIAVRAVYARLQARWDARDTALRALVERWRAHPGSQHHTGTTVGSYAAGRIDSADELEQAIGDSLGVGA